MDIMAILQDQQSQDLGVKPKDLDQPMSTNFFSQFMTESVGHCKIQLLEDPVQEQIDLIMRNVANLCTDDNTLDIVIQYLTEKKGKLPNMSTFEMQKHKLEKEQKSGYSTSTNILMRAIRKILDVSPGTQLKESHIDRALLQEHLLNLQAEIFKGLEIRQKIKENKGFEN